MIHQICIDSINLKCTSLDRIEKDAVEVTRNKSVVTLKYKTFQVTVDFDDLVTAFNALVN